MPKNCGNVLMRDDEEMRSAMGRGKGRKGGRCLGRHGFNSHLVS